MTQSEQVKIVARVLKKRIPNLSHEEVVFIAWLVVEALEEPPTKVEVNNG
jgi:hypothetical protein